MDNNKDFRLEQGRDRFLDSEKKIKNNKKRGFANMSPERQREIASMGGKVSQASGNANRFNSETGREAGRKGGLASKKGF